MEGIYIRHMSGPSVRVGVGVGGRSGSFFFLVLFRRTRPVFPRIATFSPLAAERVEAVAQCVEGRTGGEKRAEEWVANSSSMPLKELKRNEPNLFSFSPLLYGLSFFPFIPSIRVFLFHRPEPENCNKQS